MSNSWGLAQPPGCRATEIGGAWEATSAPGDDLQADLQRLSGDVSPLEFRFFRQELKQRMHEAELGRLRLSERGEVGTVDVMGRDERILEIRLSARHLATLEKRFFRLYFTEPDVLPDTLVALVLAWKQPDPPGKAEQDQHIDQAVGRAERHMDLLV